MKRTVTCGQLTKADNNTEVILNGWVHRNRDHGGIHFVNLRDRYGLTQVVVDEDAEASLKDLAKSLKFEYCVAIKGQVRLRPASMVNPDMPTGEVEIKAQEIRVLSKSKTLPFMIDDEAEAREGTRLEYRYLDLRNLGMQKRIQLRHAVSYATREYLVGQDFYEIETPTLIKSTPEGARDFLVPSRLHPGKFFALPQSPQLFKQILMVSGFDKYFQLARCYRDEDARGDRQLEFTQIDMEMSFVSREEIFRVTEDMLRHIFSKTMNYTLPEKFDILSYDDAMNRYGSDKPDTRFALELQDFGELARLAEFSVFNSVLDAGGCIKALVVPSAAADYSRKKITELEEHAKTYGAKGLAWMKVTDDGLDGGISKFYSEAGDSILAGLKAKSGDLILFVADQWKTACTALGAVRNRLGRDLGVIKKGEFKVLWVVDFPLFEYDDETESWTPAHHMFSMPQEQYLETMEQDPGAVKGDLYDLVLNGYELGSGSIRIHDPELQSRVFRIVGFDEEEAKERFGFLLKAFDYGPPPHGGVALGLDRMVMIMAEKESIKEVIPFPKNTVGVSPMEDSPALVDKQQLDDLHLAVLRDMEE